MTVREVRDHTTGEMVQVPENPVVRTTHTHCPDCKRLGYPREESVLTIWNVDSAGRSTVFRSGLVCRHQREITEEGRRTMGLAPGEPWPTDPRDPRWDLFTQRLRSRRQADAPARGPQPVSGLIEDVVQQAVSGQVRPQDRPLPPGVEPLDPVDTRPNVRPEEDAEVIAGWEEPVLESEPSDQEPPAPDE